jgi:hypothetical protein
VPAKALKVIAARLIVAELVNQLAEIEFFQHWSTMPKKSKKHPKDMTDDEALKHIFHPKLVAGVKKHLAEHNAKVGKSQPRDKA